MEWYDARYTLRFELSRDRPAGGTEEATALII
jgi:hypothetical protein